jgi:Bacterial protein of unknown function (DUF899)
MSEQNSNQWDESKNVGLPVAGSLDTAALPAVVDRATFQAELDRLRVREKAHTREGDAIAAARRRLPMVEVDPTRFSRSFDEARLLVTAQNLLPKRPNAPFYVLVHCMISSCQRRELLADSSLVQALSYETINILIMLLRSTFKPPIILKGMKNTLT